MVDSAIHTRQHSEHLWIVTLSGEHDIVDAGEVEQAMASVFDAGSTLVLDLTDSTFIDSTIMNAILAAHETAERSGAHKMAVIAPRDSHPRRVLDIGLDGYIDVYDDLPAALAAVQ